jgi:hypothetical protein
MSDEKLLLLGGAIGLVAVALWKYLGSGTTVYGQGSTVNGLTLNAGSAADNAQIIPADED